MRSKTMSDRTISFSFDEVNIISATMDDVVLQGTTDYYNEPCIIYMNRAMFHNAIDEWLNQKQSYYERYSYYCGAGNVIIKHKDLKKKAYLHTVDKKVDTHRAISFTIDMEHG